MDDGINWDKVNALPKKKRDEFIDALQQGMINSSIERLEKEKKEKEGLFIGYLMLFFVLFSLGIAGILWLLTLVFSFVTFNWIFVGVVSAILSIVASLVTYE